jgi:DNA-binding transcriptional regulator YiaG
MTKKKIRTRIGSDFDDFLKEEEILSEVEVVAAKRVIAWQIAEIMEKEQISKTAMAARMSTSRAVLKYWGDSKNPGKSRRSAW